MVQWQDPAVLSRLSAASIRLYFCLLGLYGWEYLGSLDVEYALLRSRVTFRWVLLPYLVGRISLLLCLVFMSMGTSWGSSRFACSASVLLTALTGTIAVGCASMNLMIRTWTIWNHSHIVHAMLLLASIGQWATIAIDIANIKSSWVNDTCGNVFVDPATSTIVYVYTISYDLFVFGLSAVGLSRQFSKSPLRKQLLIQGLSYFVATIVAYIPATVFSCLGVEAMITMTGLTAACASVIASSRVVKSLLGLRQPRSHNALDDETAEVSLTTHIQLPTSHSGYISTGDVSVHQP